MEAMVDGRMMLVGMLCRQPSKGKKSGDQLELDRRWPPGIADRYATPGTRPRGVTVGDFRCRC